MNKMDFWTSEFNEFRRFNPAKNDRLEVVAGKLVLTKGTHDRTMGVMVTSNPKALADHLESLIDQTAKPLFEALQQNPSYEEVTLLRKQIKILQSKIFDLKKCFNSQDLSRKVEAQRYSALYAKASDLYNHLEALKKAQDRPLSSERGIVHYQYDVEDRIKFRHPKRVPVEETVEAAQEALRLSVKEPTVKKIARVALLAIPLMGASLIHGLKLLLWNPFEKLIYGGLKTESPFDKLIRIAFPENPHYDQMVKLAHQLMRLPVITPAAVDGIVSLAPYFTQLELKGARIVEDDITTYAPLLQGKNVQQYLETLKKVCADKQIHRVSLEEAQRLLSEFHKYPRNASLEFFLGKEFEPPQIVDGKSYFYGDAPQDLDPHISREGMMRILGAMVQSKNCKTIELSHMVCGLPEVAKLLTEHGLKVQDKGRFKLCVR